MKCPINLIENNTENSGCHTIHPANFDWMVLIWMLAVLCGIAYIDMNNFDNFNNFLFFFHFFFPSFFL